MSSFSFLSILERTALCNSIASCGKQRVLEEDVGILAAMITAEEAGAVEAIAMVLLSVLAGLQHFLSRRRPSLDLFLLMPATLPTKINEYIQLYRTY